ncbi:MAG: fructose-bisphosphatase class III, partial [Acetatifactor sp.]|nr:fructose-bisphosphatase class III [Acetatifactor sp.]
VVEKLQSRSNISDTDKGAALYEQINDLRELLQAYRSGLIKENS